MTSREQTVSRQSGEHGRPRHFRLAAEPLVGRRRCGRLCKCLDERGTVAPRVRRVSEQAHGGGSCIDAAKGGSADVPAMIEKQQHLGPARFGRMRP